jgi:hypothetical protein
MPGFPITRLLLPTLAESGIDKNLARHRARKGQS